MIKVEIWSDIACPFCYIGKRRFEEALLAFSHKKEVQVVWKSFQLDPSTRYVAGKSIHEVLADKKGWSPAYARQAAAQVSEMAAAHQLHFDMDLVKPANTFLAHKLAHLCAKFGKQDQAEEMLFSAYFVEGKNIEDLEVLRAIAFELSIDAVAFDEAMASELVERAVLHDISEAQQLGVRGVPFFVVNRKYAVSGAQSSSTFVQLLEQAWQESSSSAAVHDVDSANAADACAIGGDC